MQQSRLVVRVESSPGPVGCPDCGVLASSQGRRRHRLVDIPAFGTPVRLVWVRRTWACRELLCPRRSFTEVDEDLAPSRSTWTTRARLLDLVPGRSKKAYADWLTDRGEGFTTGVQVATLDPFHGYKSAIDDELAEATAVLDVFHVVALGTKCVDEVRRRVQQDTTRHRGRKGDPLYGIQNILRAGAENLTDKQRARITRAFAAQETHDEVDLAWQCAQQLRSAYKHPDKGEGRMIAERIVDSFPTCPIPEIGRRSTPKTGMKLSR